MNAFLDGLVNVLTAALVTSVAVTDASRCDVVKVGSLQDDPTSKNPFCLVWHHPDLGSKPGWVDHKDADILGEIGFGQRWTHYFKIRATAYSRSKETTRAHQEVLLSRIMEALLTQVTLGGISERHGSLNETIPGIETTVIQGYGTKIRGGDKDWFGDVEIVAHYHTETA